MQQYIQAIAARQQIRTALSLRMPENLYATQVQVARPLFCSSTHASFMCPCYF